MKWTWMLAAVLCLPSGTCAQTALPSGTIIPISLDHSLNASKVHPGQEFHATVMQDVPGTAIRRREQVVGHVVKVSTAKDGEVSLEFRFDGVRMHGKVTPFQADLRALASFLEVEEAQIPKEMASRGITPETADTIQIGGEQVYRGGGPVADGETTVGEPTAWGVLAVPRTQPGQPCRGVVGDNTLPQAMWLFSSNACGVYGFSNIRIEHAGRTDPLGTVVLSSRNGKLNLKSGSGMLLRVS